MYERALIGKKIASGGDRKVFMYGSDRVIKISTLSFLVGRSLHDKLLRDHRVAERYFSDFVVDTLDVTPERERAHIEIQPYVRGTALRKEHVRNPKVRSQLAQIQESVSRMIRDGNAPIDLIGHAGMLGRCLSNIIVDEHDNLRIIDTALLESRSVLYMGILLEPLFSLVKFVQKKRLKDFLQ